MSWFKAHWKAVAVSAVVFVVGVGIGASGSSSKTATTIIHDHTVTAQQGTGVAATQTVTETTIVTQAPKVTPKPTPAAKAVNFSGNGGKTLPAFTVSHDATLHWTCDGSIFQIFDLDTNDLLGISVNSQAHSGTTAVHAGHYNKIQVNAIGNWAITIR